MNICTNSKQNSKSKSKNNNDKIMEESNIKSNIFLKKNTALKPQLFLPNYGAVKDRPTIDVTSESKISRW